MKKTRVCVCVGVSAGVHSDVHVCMSARARLHVCVCVNARARAFVYLYACRWIVNIYRLSLKLLSINTGTFFIIFHWRSLLLKKKQNINFKVF